MTISVDTTNTASKDTPRTLGRPSATSATQHRDIILSPISLEVIGDWMSRYSVPLSELNNSLGRLFKLVADPVVSPTTLIATKSVASTDFHGATGPKTRLITTLGRGIPSRPAWRPQIETASTHEEIIAVLRLFELDAVADRLGYLRSFAYDDPDEAPIEIESLRAMTLFLMSQRQLRDPQIGVTPDGAMQIEWRLPSNGILAMEFLPSGLIRFAAISAPAQRGVDRLSVTGTLPVEATLEAVRPFTVLL